MLFLPLGQCDPAWPPLCHDTQPHPPIMHGFWSVPPRIVLLESGLPNDQLPLRHSTNEPLLPKGSWSS